MPPDTSDVDTEGVAAGGTGAAATPSTAVVDGLAVDLEPGQPTTPAPPRVRRGGDELPVRRDVGPGEEEGEELLLDDEEVEELHTGEVDFTHGVAAPGERTVTVPPVSTPPRAPSRVTVPPPLRTRPPAPPAPAPRSPARAPLPAGEAAPASAGPEVPAEPEASWTLSAPSVLDQALGRVGDGDWEAEASLLAAELERQGDPQRVAALAYELGELCAQRLRDEARAVKAYGRALQADPSLRANLWAIRRIFYRRGLWPNLVKLIEAELRFARDPQERADLLVEKARLQLGPLQDRDGARLTLERALECDPVAMPALLALERMALADRDQGALVQVLRQLAAAAVAPERKVIYLLELARAEAASGDAEGLAQARATVREAAVLGVEGLRVARLAERLAAQAGDVAGVIEAIELGIAELARTGGEWRLRTVVAERRRQARLLRQLGDAEGAWGLLQAASALSPGEPLLLADLADLAESLGKFADLAELCEGWESLAGDSPRALVLGLKRADALLRSGRALEAQALLDSLEGRAPGNLAILALRERDALDRMDVRALAGCHEAIGESARTGATFQPDGDAGDPLAAAACFLGAGDLYAMHAADPVAAERAYRRALEVAPGWPPALLALAALLEERGEFPAVAELLEQGLAGAEPGLRGQLLEQIAAAHDQAGNRSGLEQALRRLLVDEPERGDLLLRLDEVLAAQGRHSERLAVLDQLVQASADPAEQVGFLHRAARVAGRELGDLARACDDHRRILEIAPDDASARAALRAALRDTAQWDELVSACRAEADQLADGPALVPLLREAAAVAHQRLGRPGDAVRLYRHLLDRCPGEPAAARGLVRALVDAGDEEALVEALELAIEVAGTAPEQVNELLRLGLLHERAGRSESAAVCYQRAVDSDPGSLLAHLGLVETAARLRDTPVRAAALLALAEGRRDPRVRAELLEEAGWVWSLGLDEPQRAGDCFAQALAAEPGRRGALLGSALVHAQLAALSGGAAAGHDGAPLAELARVIDGGYARAALLLRAAALAQAAGDRTTASARLAEALKAAPDDAGTVLVVADALPAEAGLLASAGERSDPGQACQELAELLAQRAALADSGARGDLLLAQAGWLERAGRLAEAAACAAEVLAQHPDDLAALVVLGRICRRGGDRQGLARVSLQLARLLGDPAGKLAQLRQAAAIWDGELGDVAASIVVYERILAEEPGAAEYDRLHALYEARGDAARLLALLGSRLNWLSQTGADAATVPLLLERSRLQRARGERRSAVKDLQALLEIAPDERTALRELAQLYQELDEPRAAAGALEQLLAVEEDGAQRTEAELLLAQILAESMQDIAGAITQLENVVAATPLDVAARERLVGLLVRGECWQRAVEELAALRHLRASDRERAADRLRAAALLRDRLGQPERALEELVAARALEPLALDPVWELAELSEQVRGGRARRAVLGEAQSDLAAAIGREPARIELYERLVQVAAWQDDDTARYYALAAAAALGPLAVESQQFVDEFAARWTAPPVLAREPVSTAELAAALRVPGADGPAHALWLTLAPALVRTVPHEPAEMAGGRTERLSSKQLARDWPLLQASLQCFALGDLEVHLVDGKEELVRAVSGARPLLVVGRSAATLATPAVRFGLGRALAHLHEGTAGVAELAATELVAALAAAARLAELELPPVLAGLRLEAAELAERARWLNKHLPRRERKQLSGQAPLFAQLDNPAAWRTAVRYSGARAGLLFAGDLQIALDLLDLGRGGRSLLDDRPALEFLAWAASPEHLALRARAGVRSGPTGERGR
jgi:Tfp pilus assembly protein PilF